MYKISNLNLENKCIFLAGGSLYVLLQMEAAIISAAREVKAYEAEKKFNDIVNAAVDDYKATMDGIIEKGNWFDIDLLSNFNEFLNVCIDIRKKAVLEFEQMERNVAAHVAETKKRDEAEAAEMEKNVAAVAAAAENNALPPPAKKSRK